VSEYFHATSYRVNLQGAALYFPITDDLTFSQVELDSCQNLSTMPDSNSLNTSFLELLKCFKNESVFIRDFRDLVLQFTLNAWWVSFNVSWKYPTAGSNSRYVTAGDSIYIVGFRKLASPVSYVLLLINFFAIHQYMKPVQWGNTSLQKHRLQR